MMKYALLLLSVTGLNSLLASDLVNPTPSTICNPLNLDYKIQADHEKGWYREAADPVGSVTIDRKPESRGMALVSWPSVPGAEGYIVRYGTAPDALQNRFEVRGTNSLEITCLNSDPGYWFAVDSFNPGGVTPFSKAPAAVR
jgi:hypothetical protein